MMPEQAALVQKARDSLRAARLLRDDNLYDFTTAAQLMGPLSPAS